MVILIKQDNDYTSHLIELWLKKNGADYFVFSENTKIKGIEIQICENNENFFISTESKTINLFSSNNVFFIRGILTYKVDLTVKIESLLSDFIDAEIKSCIQYFEQNLMRYSNRILGNIEKSKFNKMTNLLISKKNGFQIPKTLITDNHKIAHNFIDNCTGITITKPCYDVLDIKIKGGKEKISSKTTQIKLKDLPNDDFYPSKLQEYIEKEIEIRVVIVEKKIYAMGIFSQKNIKTRIDNRNYDFDYPNRKVPILLKKSVKDKLLKFTKELNVNFGIFDIILTKSGEYIFLEFNEDGQFDDISYLCNYQIEKEIAELLKK